MLGPESHPRYSHYISPLVDERTQWASTRECLRVLTNDYTKEIRYHATVSRQMMEKHKDDPQLVNFFDKMWGTFQNLDRVYRELAPAVRMKRLNIDPHTKIRKCPQCNGDGYIGKQNEWCAACDGWGYAVKSIFEYLDCTDPPGIVLYIVRNGVVVDYITYGKKVTVEI